MAWDGDDFIVDLHVQPRASKDEFAGLFDGRVKVRVKASPVDGKANEHLIAFLAKQFEVAKSQVLLVRGESARDKRFRIRKPKSIPPGMLDD